MSNHRQPRPAGSHTNRTRLATAEAARGGLTTETEPGREVVAPSRGQVHGKYPREAA